MNGRKRVGARQEQIQSALGEREIVWFGTRGVDALALGHIGRLGLVVSQTAPVPDSLESVFGRQDCLEQRTFLRRDLDRYDIDVDPDPEAQRLKAKFLERIDAPVVLVVYRPQAFLGRPSFCLPDLRTASNFHLLQRQFEYKPWVELQLAEHVGVPVLRSQFVNIANLARIQSLLDDGPLVARAVTGSGGAGVFRFSDIQTFKMETVGAKDGYVGVAPFMSKARPFNLNACVYRDGSVAVFSISMQLIGIDSLTQRQFGFCGNDFAAASSISEALISEIEDAAVKTGRWLHDRGYVGLFGFDFLAEENRFLILELNARFQASTTLSSRINQHFGVPDPMTEHVAAFLGLSAPEMPSLFQQVLLASNSGADCPVAQMIHRNVSTTMMRSRGLSEGVQEADFEIECDPEPGVHVEPEAMLFRSLHYSAVTETGHVVDEAALASRGALNLTVS